MRIRKEMIKLERVRREEECAWKWMLVGWLGKGYGVVDQIELKKTKQRMFVGEV